MHYYEMASIAPFVGKNLTLCSLLLTKVFFPIALRGWGVLEILVVA